MEDDAGMLAYMMLAYIAYVFVYGAYCFHSAILMVIMMAEIEGN